MVYYQKLLGQLHNAGNTITLTHYLQLLSNAGMLTGLQKYLGSEIRQRSSSPKFLSLNNALISSQSQYNFKEAKLNTDFWGRLIENAIGSHLYSATIGTKLKLMYWREGSYKVDFVLQKRI
ncbi:DUF4143 domain-containing protein [Rosettibacter primus]|uniref:DUF4143 domain-containing protein n=1 Tax=Rosettibacter primus TaxID=3111523 RepID=UPI003EBC49A7